jgi:TRAP-type uncharacterized transport system substrate-binding protein
VTIKRYNAAVQRAKGILEMAASLYDSSLSSESFRPAEGVLQSDSRVGRAVKVALGDKRNEGKNGVSLSFATGSFREVMDVAEGKISLAWVNPSAMLTMACRGKGPFTSRLSLRPIAVFPSYDVMGFAVHESTGITSLSQIKKTRFPLRLSTRRVTRTALETDATMFTVSATLAAAGFTLTDIQKWGGRIYSVSRPSDPARIASIESGEVNAIFDEGIKSWSQTALDHSFCFLPVEGTILRRLVALGYRPTVMPKSRFQGLPKDIPTIDFSGWPMIVRADMADDVAYALCEAIEKRKELMPTDNYRPLEIAQLCANDEEAPYDVPLHPGAERFYREKGYLNNKISTFTRKTRFRRISRKSVRAL